MTVSDPKPTQQETAEQFLARWSQRKQQARAQTPAASAGTVQPIAETPLPQLPAIEQLDINSDFSGFFHPKVDEVLRRAALKKLFSDPHFNIMDGLDTYIDDYASDPLPAAMLGELKHAQQILAWARDRKEDEGGEQRDQVRQDQPIDAVAGGSPIVADASSAGETAAVVSSAPGEVPAGPAGAAGRRAAKDDGQNA